MCPTCSWRWHVARPNGGVDRPRRVGHNQHLDPQQLHDANGQRYLLQAVSFIIVRAPLLDENRLSFQLACQQLPLVPLHRAWRPIRYFGGGNDVRMVQGLGQRPEA